MYKAKFNQDLPIGSLVQNPHLVLSVKDLGPQGLIFLLKVFLLHVHWNREVSSSSIASARLVYTTINSASLVKQNKLGEKFFL